ncbi:hypothetical protein IX318_000838 [Porphyromonas levii]|uniref:AAA family ATPase n=2 Tax=Porphyromonas levii TaxID=28114 RepID=UPI001BAB72FC|nr:ATP-binding protein [Porphyromonas levii]MBR8712937.1 hypothetical protein [Porphyromonas levii]MBR8714985.1 hypothetical protein [Porphyromonas levii]MBR8727476.1 hypothetical protein [Porphyromonas levii]MBR8735804.1 hypothetical protein [Porphyromonas levii]MBR8777876.1 hypothetical protein [Porphyromonas levii]
MIEVPIALSSNMKPIERIEIHSFGPLRDVVIEDIRPLTVLIGPSGSGKSTLLKVLALFRWLLKMQNIRSFLKQSGIRRSPFRFTFNSYISNNGWRGFVSKETKIIYQYGNSIISYQDGKLNVPEITEVKGLHLEKIAFISDNRVVIPDMLAGQVRANSFYLNETYSDFLLAMEELEQIDIPYLNVHIAREKKSSGQVVYRVEGKGAEKYSISLFDASSGTQSVLPIEAITRYYTQHFNLVKALNQGILRLLVNNDKLSDFKAVTNVGDIDSKRISVMIEEPELSLWPEMQMALMQRMVGACVKDGNVGVMLTTHSPYVLASVNNLIFAHQVGELNAEAASRVVPQMYWLNPDNVAAFMIKEGEIADIMDSDLRQIQSEYIDSASAIINEQYDQLFDIKHGI